MLVERELRCIIHYLVRNSSQTTLNNDLISLIIDFHGCDLYLDIYDPIYISSRCESAKSLQYFCSHENYSPFALNMTFLSSTPIPKNNKTISMEFRGKKKHVETSTVAF